MALVIDQVLPGPAEMAGIRAGDRIFRVNGHTIHDELEYRFFSSEEWVEIEIQRPETGQFLIKKIPGFQDIGLVFARWEPVQCNNHCIFCFVDQLPEGMRSSLYVKDEDYRLSFLNGNFLTFSTVADNVLQRICTMKLSPLYVSVHATDHQTRNKMLGRKHTRNILEIIKILTQGGIVVHAQVVLCPGINDSEILDQTIRDLLAFYPGVGSLAIVPVGLTKYRGSKGLCHLRPITRDYALEKINEINKIQAACRMKYDNNFVFLSDEFYIKANRRFPSYASYGDFPQLENGVGMIPKFMHSWRQKRHSLRQNPLRGRPVILVTGRLAYPYIAQYIKHHIEFSGVNVRLLPIPNRFFGPRVTVTGLLTANDLEKELRPVVKPGNVLLVPDVMLKENENVFLDNISMNELAETLRVEVERFAPNPEDFEKILYQVAFKV